MKKSLRVIHSKTFSFFHYNSKLYRYQQNLEKYLNKFFNIKAKINK